nr:MAG TPA: hypothetical protein [Caudoviricetes sp.]
MILSIWYRAVASTARIFRCQPCLFIKQGFYFFSSFFNVFTFIEYCKNFSCLIFFCCFLKQFTNIHIVFHSFLLSSYLPALLVKYSSTAILL